MKLKYEMMACGKLFRALLKEKSKVSVYFKRLHVVVSFKTNIKSFNFRSYEQVILGPFLTKKNP